ncbi:MAG: DUF3307 domain-containing protein [Desulfovibrionaceae bacterium]
MEPVTASPLFVALGLLFSHLLADFVLQPDSWVQAKGARLFSWQLAAHAGVAGGLTALVLWGRGGVLAPACVFASHALIDACKARFAPASLRALLLDQALHLLVLGAVLAWAVPEARGPLGSALGAAAWAHGLLLACSLVVVTRVGGVVIGFATSQWRAELIGCVGAHGLARAGNWIGMLERTLILIFVLVSSWEAIGFLITAKTILRFREIQGTAERKVAEYILVGTLMSFLWAIVVGLGTARLLAAVGAGAP